MIISTLGTVFGALVAIAFISFYFAMPEVEGTPRKTVSNISALLLGSTAAGIVAAMFWTLLDTPVVWP